MPNAALVCCEPKISKHCTSGKPASIMVANSRVKVTRSLVLTLGLPNLISLQAALLFDFDRRELLLAKAVVHRFFVLSFHDALADLAGPATGFPSKLGHRFSPSNRFTAASQYRCSTQMPKCFDFPEPGGAPSPLAMPDSRLAEIARQFVIFPAVAPPRS